MLKWINTVSPVMKARGEAFNIDIQLAQNALRDTVLKKVLPDRGAVWVAEMNFIGIKKMQRIADVITWLGAYRAGIGKFNNDQTKAIEFADLTVNRSQGSAIFGQRTAAERGSISPKFSQSEMVRIFTPLMSYFIAKNNVAFERVKKTNLKNPLQLANLAIDLVMLYVMEAMFIAFIKGGLPDEDESDIFWAIKEGAFSVAAGLPIARDVAALFRGFPGGGVVGSLGNDLKKLGEGTIASFEEEELDPRVGDSFFNLVGIYTKWPASQINRTRRAIRAADEGEAVAAWEFVFGPKYEE
jgi:hypothetical protein